jgi:ParB family chromosome partitioning protein
MTRAQPKIALSQSRDIPFDKLILSQSNVRHIRAGVGIEELAEDIARHTLLQSITVRPLLDDSGAETGVYEIPAGGRRFRALELLVKQRRLAKTAPIPCVIRTDGLAEEDSLAENVQRLALHPLDQFRAFLALREKGQSEEEIAAAFFVAPSVVKQRLRLASVSPKLLDVYAEDGMTLDQLMAFTVNANHERQEQVWDAVQRTYGKEAYQIRRMLTEHAVRANDKRALFVGIDAYVEAGGTVLRDLFHDDDGGWLQDPGLLDMMVAERLRDEAEIVRAEGWRWIEAAPEIAYGRTFGMRCIQGERREPSDDEWATRDALVAERDEIEAAYCDEADLPEEIDRRVTEIDAALATLDDRPTTYRLEDLSIAGAFVSIDAAGRLRVQRGYIRPEDEPKIEAEALIVADKAGADPQFVADASYGHDAADVTSPAYGDIADEPSETEDEGLKPIPDRLLTELTAVRTLALREAVGRSPEVALLAALHVLCVRVFYHYTQDSCIELLLKSVRFGSVPGLADNPLAATIETRHRTFAERMPRDPADLWDTLTDLDAHVRAELFAHCVSQGVNALYESWNKRPRAIAHADRLAVATHLDMAVNWAPTADNYLGRVTKARIVEAVREARGDASAERLNGCKKVEMVERAEVLLAGTGWLPEPLRTPGQAIVFAAGADKTTSDPAYPVLPEMVEQSAVNDGVSAMGEDHSASEYADVAFEPFAIAAE